MDATPSDSPVTSPAAAGPAGAGFEVKLGGYYLLSLLAKSAPHALPGTVAVKIAFQRASEGFPLDDVVVHADDTDGNRATLQLQAKRTITFAPQDQVFKDVVAQIAKAVEESGFWDKRNELAVATPRTTTKIAGAYQEVLTWARDLGSHDEFFSRLARPGSANPEMRTFVDTFRTNLKNAGAPHDDFTLWRILRRFHILTFDFDSSGSHSESYALAHVRMLLPPDRATDAGALWSTLVAIALDKAATGGDLDHIALTEELKRKGIQTAGERSLAPDFSAITSEAHLTLTDIGITVGATRLARHERLAEVRDARRASRFVVIRGDAGVGKSGLLRQTAEQDLENAPVLVLAPSRVAPNGFLAHCRRLGHQGTPEDLLFRLAASGSATLFIDNLDRFSEEERVTIRDALRVTSRLTGVMVVATARASPVRPDDDWLPQDAIAALGGETTVLVEELTENDLQEIRAAEPSLRALLADTHPAKAVVRNLFRLSRIARLPAGEDIPTTELAMATEWWETADGPEPGRRERQRVLRKVAEAVIAGHDVVDVADQDASAVNALIRSETFLERAPDRVAFRHDVLREWAAACRLIVDPSLIPTLPLARPATPVLARAIELAARAALERQTASPSWHDILATVRGPTHHTSWRRAVILAIVNSEMAAILLDRVATSLRAGHAQLLAEVTRAVRAVNVLPAEVVLKDLVLPQGTVIPKGLFIPHGNAWPRLAMWLIENFDSIPALALKDVVDFFWDLCLGTSGHNPFTPYIIDSIYPLIRRSRTGEPSSLDELSSTARKALLETLRLTFLTYCGARPALAANYLKLLADDSDRALQTLTTEPGDLPRAAPQPFADLIRSALIKLPERHAPGSYGRFEPFSYVDSFFYPPSDKTKAFVGLLTYAPAIALSLIRDIVAHAITVLSRGKQPGEDGIILVINGQERFFPWMNTYRWAREEGPNVVAVALVALRTWALARVEKGDAINAIIAEILGPVGTSAAFVLVAVDLLRSIDNLPLEEAVPFVGSPELLCLERQYNTLDQIAGRSRSSLATPGSAFNPQRLPPLQHLLLHYARAVNAGAREVLRNHLEAAAQRLGPPDADSNYGDPRLMATLAINWINPDNWSPDPQDPGRSLYTSPPEQARREQVLQASVNTDETRDFAAHTQLLMAVAAPERVDLAFAQTVAKWVADAAPDSTRTHPDGQDRRRAAYIVLRHGSDATVAEHGQWAIDALIAAAGLPQDPFGSASKRLEYSSAALAFAGLFHAHKRNPSEDLLARLLRVVASNPIESSVGANAVSTEIAALDPRLSLALARSAFVASVKPRPSRRFDEARDEAAQRTHTDVVASHVVAELAWLKASGVEPVWPTFPVERRRKRRGIRLPGKNSIVPEVPPPPRAESFVDERVAAAWIPMLFPLCHGGRTNDIITVMHAYQAYTFARNGGGLDRHDDLDGFLHGDWNDAYHGLIAALTHALSPDQLDAASRAITELPDRAFLDVAATLLDPLHARYFGGGDLLEQLIKTRSAFVTRLLDTWEWKNHIRTPTGGIETHLGYTVPPLLFGTYVLGGRIGCSLGPDNLDRLLPLLPGASPIVKQGPTVFTAGLALSLLETKADARMLPFALDIVEAALDAHPNDTAFWADYAIGQRWCRWLDALHVAHPASLAATTLLQARVHAVLGRLASIGIAEAAALERKLLT
jgi:hypothetical protein